MPNETTTDPYAVAAQAIQQIIETEFAAEQVVAIHDKIHESLGEERIACGIAPLRESLLPGNALVNSFTIEVRFYGLWDREVDPEQLVDPRLVTGRSNRLKRALQQAQASFPGSPEVWYFDWVATDYPDDPTGNKTRFHMTIRVHGDNTGLIETR